MVTFTIAWAVSPARRPVPITRDTPSIAAQTTRAIQKYPRSGVNPKRTVTGAPGRGI